DRSGVAFIAVLGRCLGKDVLAENLPSLSKDLSSLFIRHWFGLHIITMPYRVRKGLDCYDVIFVEGVGTPKRFPAFIACNNLTPLRTAILKRFDGPITKEAGVF